MSLAFAEELQAAEPESSAATTPGEVVRTRTASGTASADIWSEHSFLEANAGTSFSSRRGPPEIERFVVSGGYSCAFVFGDRSGASLPAGETALPISMPSHRANFYVCEASSPFAGTTTTLTIDALTWVQLVSRLAGPSYCPPLISESPWGETVFEWWNGDRKLTVYYSPNGIEYVRVWGPDIDSEMESGSVGGPELFLKLWNWLSGR